MQSELADLLYKEVLKVDKDDEKSEREKIISLYSILKLVFYEATKSDRLHFTTYFSRIAYAGNRYGLSKKLLYFVHRFRVYVARIYDGAGEEELDNEKIWKYGLYSITNTIKEIFKQDAPKALHDLFPPDLKYEEGDYAVIAKIPAARVVAVSIDEKNHILTVIDNDKPHTEHKVKYNIPEINENFNSSISSLVKSHEFPVILKLLEIDVDENEFYLPRALVIEPDYLIDVTAIAQCFQDHGQLTLSYILKKFLSAEASHYLLLGNIANFFLDELITNPEAEFHATFKKVFQLDPIGFTLFSDKDIRMVMMKSKMHFDNLKKSIQLDFAKEEIDINNVYLEPSFYSNDYGIQGRLDVLHQNLKTKKGHIVELKSGKPYKPNLYGLSHSHYRQTILYDLLIKSSHQDIDITNYILYSSQHEQTLRFAPAIAVQQKEAISLRNELIEIEHQLIGLADNLEEDSSLLSSLDPAKSPKLSGFIKADLNRFWTSYSHLNKVEKKYFKSFNSFIAREHRIAKVGRDELDSINGLASLWLNGIKEKSDNFNIISFLTFNSQQTDGDAPVLEFKRETKDELSNFREGDIAILYPFNKGRESVTNNQIYKCTILSMGKLFVRVRLRSKQVMEEYFKSNNYWNLEHDLLDSSFLSMYRNLFAFIESPSAKRNLLLGQIPPAKPTIKEVIPPSSLNNEQASIFKKIINAEDYFLLWGPPGTGKTSFMLKHLVDYILSNSKEEILLLAYTNRAVDEICEAIESIGPEIRENYLRIGSRYSTRVSFRDQLLSSQIQNITRREELKNLIKGRRIIVSTVSSMIGRKGIFHLKKFDRVIIDEASQILEPMLVGLLPLFNKFILIGDHKQLPAVVSQKEEESEIKDKSLRALGLSNMRDSLFERMMKQCEKNNWTWAFDGLSEQGRMHFDIMKFPSEHFYEGKLKVIQEPLAINKRLTEQLNYRLPENNIPIEELIANHRMIYVPTFIDRSVGKGKTNKYEAKSVIEILNAFKRMFLYNGVEFSSKSIGIITPYRAQIAMIRQTLLESQLDFDNVSIDTVERYQGGSRDIIIFSLCTNRITQLNSLVSMSEEGVDRKLNVALTRARDQLVILGNKDILSTNETYSKLLAYCFELPKA